MTMTYLDNMLLHELYEELDRVVSEMKQIRQFHVAPNGKTTEQALQELEEEEYLIRLRIEELSIVEDDYCNDEF